MEKEKFFELLCEKIRKYDNQISNVLNDFTNGFKEKYWKIIRIHWIKNRLILDTFYKKKFFKKKIIQQIHLKHKLDLNLINLWCKKEFSDLCSTKVLLNPEKNLGKIFCRIPLLRKNFNSFFLIQNNSGCVCCVRSFNLKLPIWWDQIGKILKVSKNIKKKSFFLFSLFYNHFTENFLKKNKKLNFIKKASFLLIFKLKINASIFNRNRFKIFFWDFLRKNIIKKKNNFRLFNW